MKARWALLLVAALAAVTFIPLATAGAQDPSATTDPNQTIEGSGPLGGDIICETSATLDPDHGPPGTVVTVSAEFFGNCDDFFPVDFVHECFGEVSGEGFETFSFPVEDGGGKVGPDLIGMFTAPVTEPNPPVVDAIEPLSVVITCIFETALSGAEGPSGQTTYTYPPANYDLELFAGIDTDQPTLVDTDTDVDEGTPPGVVAATPAFTG